VVLQLGGSRNPESNPTSDLQRLRVTSGAAMLRCAVYVADDVAQCSGGACGDDVTDSGAAPLHFMKAATP
jgi:hypothetical protein